MPDGHSLPDTPLAPMGIDRITFDPAVMDGKACVRGMRITAGLVLGLLARGMTVEQVIEEHPVLEPEDIRQCLRYAAWLARDGVFPT